MLRQAKIGAIVFYVKDLARSERFYRDVLGLPARVMPGDGGDGEGGQPWMMAQLESGLALVFFQRDEPVGRTPIVVFELDEGIDDVVEDLAAAGVPIVTPVSHAPGGWTADFLDPDGHFLSFYQPASAPRSSKRVEKR